MYPLGKPELQDWLCSLHDGQWFGFEGEHIYANLIIHDSQYAKPTEQECIDGLKAMQDAWLAKDYSRKRAIEYPSFANQFDTIFHDGLDAWKAQIQAVKDKYPKGSE